MTDIRGVKPPISKSEIGLVEKRLGFDIPPEYKIFLLKTNGGIPYPGSVKYDGEYYDCVAYFYSAGNDNSSNDLFRNLEEYRGVVPSHYLAIAESPGGNLYCLSLKNEDYGSVYFWEHDEANYDGETREENMILLAPSLTKFIDELYEEK